MINRKIKLLSFWVLLMVFASQLHAADVEWEGWSFDFTTNSNSSGLVLKDVDFNGKRILDKVSMPVMRVEYDNDRCGPFADILSTSRLQPANSGAPDSACNNLSVCNRTFTQDGERKLEVGANWQIGEYQIYQTYYFSANGTLDSRVYSRGLQCQVNHRHHAHWLFDFDIGDRENDRIIRGDDNPQALEFNDTTADTPYWIVEDKVTGDQVRLVPSRDDGVPDNFSKWDAAGRRYKAAETGRWVLGARGEIGDNWISPPESIDGEDVVLWYTSHLPHSASEGAGIWHASGPRIEVIASSAPPVPAPEPTPEPEPVPEPNPAPDPDPDGNTILVNGGFEDGQSLVAWDNCGSAASTSISSAAHEGSNALSIRDGGCLYQEVPVTVGQDYTLSCQAARSGNLWTIMELSFLDSSYNALRTEVQQIDTGGYAYYSITGTAPAQSVYGLALLYSEDRTTFDTCVLVPGMIESLAPDPTVDPEPDTDPVANILVNGDFEADLKYWTSCAASDLLALSNEADSGAAALSVQGGGCMYQEFPIKPGSSYSMNCRARRNSALEYTSVSLSLMNGEYNSLETAELPVTTADFTDYGATLTAPEKSVFGSVVVYSEDPAVFDNCVVTTD